jgi:quercetin dioxygenase-like cupin family protein
MDSTRIFHSAEFWQPADGEPVRSVITASTQAVVVAWYLKPGQEIAAHVHPQGQDTWTILSGQGDYVMDGAGTRQPVVAGDVVVAPIGNIHGVHNTGTAPLILISVVTPAEAGYQLMTGLETPVAELV